jgi:hypothetical protein
MAVSSLEVHLRKAIRSVYSTYEVSDRETLDYLDLITKEVEHIKGNLTDVRLNR